MNAWSVAVWALLPALGAAVAMTLRGAVATRIVAVQFASGLAVVLLEAMSFAFDQPSYVTIALVLAVLSTVGTLVMAMAVERWL